MDKYRDIIENETHMMQYVKSVLLVEANLKFPQLMQFSDKKTKQEIAFNNHYIKIVTKTEGYCQSTLLSQASSEYGFRQPNDLFTNYVHYLQFTVSYNTERFLSLFLENYEFTGGAHGTTVQTGETWDMNRGKLVSLQELFTPFFNYRSIIISNVMLQASERQKNGEVMYFENLLQNIIKYFDEKNYYLTNEGIAVFYPLYSIAPYVAGIQTFVVGYEKFGDGFRRV